MDRNALVIGSGPNGLSAALVLARAGWQVDVHEANSRLGGAASSEELTLPGFVHDVGSAVHPLALASPFFTSLPLGVRWIEPPLPLAHPLDDGTAAVLHRDLHLTAAGLKQDGNSWLSLFGPVVRHWNIYASEFLAPLGITGHPLLMARLGLLSLPSAASVIQTRLRTKAGRALFSGLAAHYPFVDQPLSAGFGIVLGAAGHAVGWPIPEGGAQKIADALVRRIEAFGGTCRVESPVTQLSERHRLILADTSPAALARIAGDLLPAGFRKKLSAFRYGPGAFKLDWALSAPIPWTAEPCHRAGTVHVGGTAEEVLGSERAATMGNKNTRPFVLLSQPTLFDRTRAPAGRHIAWAYCHVPHGSAEDHTEAIESQIERFAPGFGKLIIKRHASSPLLLEQQNANLVGGDVTGGVSDLLQTLFRPTAQRYATPNPKIWLCSASTPPGAGVHGMCGFHAATRALRAQR